MEPRPGKSAQARRQSARCARRLCLCCRRYRGVCRTYAERPEDAPRPVSPRPQRPETSSRINSRISQTLRQGKKVKVLVATPEPSEWQELPVNTTVGLEAGLIEMIRPSWNIRG